MNATDYIIIILLTKTVIYQPRFLRCFRDAIRVPRMENRVPRIREIGYLQVHTGYLTFSLKNPVLTATHYVGKHTKRKVYYHSYWEIWYCFIACEISVVAMTFQKEKALRRQFLCLVLIKASAGKVFSRKCLKIPLTF